MIDDLIQSTASDAVEGAADAAAGDMRPGRKTPRDRGRPREYDQFYTKPKVAEKCMMFMQETIGTPEGTWIEPSAGAGAFLRLIPHPRIGIDKDPPRDENGDVVDPEIVVEDFLGWAPPSDIARPITVVGNPPFGRNASLVFKFLNHIAAFLREGDYIGFILPRTFEKVTTQNKVNHHLELVDEFTLAANSFEHDGRDYDVPCCFQIWRRTDSKRTEKQRRLMTHPDYRILPSREGAHFTFQRVGGNAGLASTEGLEKSWRSHYYIQANIDPTELMQRFNDIDWSDVRARTAGNPSIGKTDLAEHYRAELKRRNIEPVTPEDEIQPMENYALDL